eukprot:UN03494
MHLAKFEKDEKCVALRKRLIKDVVFDGYLKIYNAMHKKDEKGERTEIIRKLFKYCKKCDIEDFVGLYKRIPDNREHALMKGLIQFYGSKT